MISLRVHPRGVYQDCSNLNGRFERRHLLEVIQNETAWRSLHSPSRFRFEFLEAVGMDYDPQDISKLRDALACSARTLENPRQKYLALVKQFVGPDYSENGSESQVPMNLLQLEAGIKTRSLSARAPRALVSTSQPFEKAKAAKLEALLNKKIQEMKLEETLKRAALNGQFGLAIATVGLVASGSTADGFMHDLGEVAVDIIDFCDFTFDMEAPRWDKIAFAANRYKVPLDWAKSTPMYDEAARSKLAAGKNGAPSERVEEISQGTASAAQEDYFPRVELIDVWLPRDGVIITLAGDEGLNEVLRVVKWNGPKCGPYHLLSFLDVPGQVLPLAPLSQSKALHELANEIFCKIAIDAINQKEITAVRANSAKDEDIIRNSTSGDIVNLSDPRNIQQMKFRGADQGSVALMPWIQDLHSRMAGNLDVEGGLSPQADTLGQEKLLAENSSKQMAEMGDRFIAFVSGIIRAMAWYYWSDPIQSYNVTRPVPGLSTTLHAQLAPEERTGELSYDIAIDPYSMQHQSPGQKLQSIMNFVQQVVFPGMPQIQAQGRTFDFNEFISIVAKLGNVPEIEDLLPFAPPEQQEQQAAPREGGSSMPATTTRRYERVNRPGASRAGKDSNMMLAAMGVNRQPDVANQAARSVA